MESMMIKIDMMPDYRSYLSEFKSCITEPQTYLMPFSQVRYWAHFHRSCKIAPIAMMEILGLDPYQSQTQYLQAKIGVRTKWKQSGNAVAALWLLSCLFVASLDRFAKTSGNKEATLLLLCCQYQTTYLQRGHKLPCPENHINLS
jgi:hypothetical protein